MVDRYRFLSRNVGAVLWTMVLPIVVMSAVRFSVTSIEFTQQGLRAFAWASAGVAWVLAAMFMVAIHRLFLENDRRPLLGSRLGRREGRYALHAVAVLWFPVTVSVMFLGLVFPGAPDLVLLWRMAMAPRPEAAVVFFWGGAGLWFLGFFLCMPFAPSLAWVAWDEPGPWSRLFKRSREMMGNAVVPLFVAGILVGVPVRLVGDLARSLPVPQSWVTAEGGAWWLGVAMSALNLVEALLTLALFVILVSQACRLRSDPSDEYPRPCR